MQIVFTIMFKIKEICDLFLQSLKKCTKKWKCFEVLEWKCYLNYSKLSDCLTYSKLSSATFVKDFENDMEI